MRARGWIFGVATLAMTAAGGTVKADVVSGHVGPDYLFFVEGAAVHRGECPAGTRFYDRETCGIAFQRADLGIVTSTFRASLGVNLAEFDQKRSQTWQQIQAIDVRLFELLNTDPSGTPAVTREELDAAERVLLAQQRKAQSLKDQVARLRLALEETPHDQDLMSQLELTRARLAVEQKEENALVGTFNELRVAFVRERGSSSTRDYEELLRLRASRSREMDGWREWVEREVTDMEDGERLLTHLLDTSFAWPEDSAPSSTSRRFEVAYTAAEVEQRTLHVRSAERYRVRFQMTDPRVVENVTCRSSTHAVRGVQYKFQMMDGNVIRSEAVVRFTSVNAGTFAVDFGERSWSRDLLVAGGFIGRAALGTWDIGYFYLVEPEGEAPVPFEGVNCRIVFVR